MPIFNISNDSSSHSRLLFSYPFCPGTALNSAGQAEATRVKKRRHRKENDET